MTKHVKLDRKMIAALNEVVTLMRNEYTKEDALSWVIASGIYDLSIAERQALERFVYAATGN